ncbi:helix-turn-helix domain-containing protein [Aliarcobacter cryaerophilus]|uniref:helix-turn-helix domain-containing protein n=1 Tax=Aliarcobacter cryaerophilus TaxID=28198 RepID=UPI0021B5FD70|nr:helix-turn-helix domain-containing protein [Aliarcobacter cryaerophilus]MCT7471196.1 helix-turn-helix domain-containing protein [Aliarcobacter cryaerophilus]
MNIKDEIETIKRELDELFPKVPNLNAKQVATYLDVSESCLENWRNKAIGPQYRKNPKLKKSRVTYSKRDLAEYYALSKVKTF